MKIESAALQFSTRPTVSRPGDSAISVLKAQRDEISKRIELVKKSNLSYETKQEKIQLLQEQAGNLNEQIAQLQLKEMTEKAKEAAQKNTNDTNDTNKDENPQAINTQVTYGLISADYSVKSGNIGGSIYRKAKTSNQDAAASRALNYAMPEYISAMKSSKKIERGLEAYHRQISEAHRIAQGQETSEVSQSSAASKAQSPEKGIKAEKA